MTFDQWTALMTDRLKRRFAALSVLARNPGVCYVNGISALDMIELHGGRVRLVPHRDPLTLVDGVLMSRHKGMTLEKREFALNDEEFSAALSCIRTHLRPDAEEF